MFFFAAGAAQECVVLNRLLEAVWFSMNEPSVLRYANATASSVLRYAMKTAWPKPPPHKWADSQLSSECLVAAGSCNGSKVNQTKLAPVEDWIMYPSLTPASSHVPLIPVLWSITRGSLSKKHIGAAATQMVPAQISQFSTSSRDDHHHTSSSSLSFMIHDHHP